MPSNLETSLFLFFLHLWNGVTWKRGFNELEEKVKFQNKSGNMKMNWKYLSLFDNYHKKIRMIRLNQNLNLHLKKPESLVFLRYSLRKIFLNSWNIRRKISIKENNLCKVAPAMLVWLLIEILQEFTKNSLQYKKFP